VETRQFPTDVAEYLRLHHVITLGTSSFTGMPHADTVIYANDDWRLYFFGIDSTTIARNVKASRYIAFTIDDYTTDWRKVRELQGVGQCQAADPGEEEWALWLCSQKFGAMFVRPAGVLFRVLPGEMHFVDYDYATVATRAIPEITERMFSFEDATRAPHRGAVSTSLDQAVFEPGQVIFRPGDRAGQYYVVVQGEVEIRAEGYGADQTVARVGPGQLFGDQGALRGQRGVFTAHAVTRTVLLAVERETMRDLLLPQDPGSFSPPPPRAP
jgi:uncharacterized protein YhbP (UPF0306 family)